MRHYMTGHHEPCANAKQNHPCATADPDHYMDLYWTMDDAYDCNYMESS